jgi:ribose 1,5-bisphosphokinase PhnN
MANTDGAARDLGRGFLHRLWGVIRNGLGWRIFRQKPEPGNTVMPSRLLFVQRLFVIVGTPGSGKDELIRAINDLGAQHARIVRKHTSRKKRPDDDDEIICPKDPDFDLEGCDIRYENYGARYGIKTPQIWGGLRDGIFQVVVVSNVDAINKLREIFGELVVLVYVHSEIDCNKYQEYQERQRIEAASKSDPEYLDTEYVEQRVKNYKLALDVFLENYLAFNHVLINSGPSENLYDQMFRLFRAYEGGDLSSATESPVPKRMWRYLTQEQKPSKPPKIIGE